MIAPVQIRRDDIVEDIRALAEITGVSMTDAVGSAVRAQLAAEREKAAAGAAKRRKQAARTLAKFRELPVIGPDLTDDDLYGPDGLPK